MRFLYILFLVTAGLLILKLESAKALEGKAIFTEKCLSCHDIKGPAPSTFEGMLKRKAPDLFYAGSKFKQSWLVQWLQSPTLIRQGGVMFLNHLVIEKGKDQINAETIKPCLAKLSAEEARAVSAYLMTLKDPTMKTRVVKIKKKFSRKNQRKALRLFSKQLPCIGCHTIKLKKKEFGGISGPDLRNAGARLNPDWIYARIQNPQYWDPKTWMPKIEMSRKKRKLLTQFIALMK